MCCIFGVFSYGGCLHNRDIQNVIESLASESMVRGVDATGFAYIDKHRMKIVKEPVPAYDINFNIPRGVSVVTAHTRQTTQGSEKDNTNNHPFFGKAGKLPFALAHNGIIFNDTILRSEHKLPATKIETDSYIAVQLIERENALSIASIKQMVEKLQGSFCFSILDAANTLYLVKGNNPLAVLHDKKMKAYFYASTEQILISGLVKSDIYHRLKTNIFHDPKSVEFVPLKEGQILRISKNGSLACSDFAMPRSRLSMFSNSRHYGRLGDVSSKSADAEYLENVKSIALDFGYDESDIENMLEEGYALDEIEDYLYNGCYRRSDASDKYKSEYYDLLY